MGQDATKVRVALTGKVWVGDEGATLPVTIGSAVSSATFDDLGYTTEDGVTFTFNKSVENIGAWQSSDPLRILITEEPKSVEFTLRQLDTVTWLQAFGGTITEPDESTYPGDFEWTPPAAGTAPVKVLIVEFTDGSINYRWIFRRTQDQGDKKITLMRTDSVNLPANYTVLAASPAWGKVQTDDPALDPTPASS